MARLIDNEYDGSPEPYYRLAYKANQRGEPFDEVEFGILYPNGEIFWAEPGPSAAVAKQDLLDKQRIFDRDCDRINAPRAELKLLKRAHKHRFSKAEEVDLDLVSFTKP